MDITPFAVNQFIPHPMMVFAASTYNKDESPHLALVSWVNFYWDDGLGVTLCMDGDKAVKRNFEREGALVLNALSRDMFDAVEALGRASGAEKDKAIARFALEAAEHVHAPRLCESPLRYELSLRENFSKRTTAAWARKMCSAHGARCCPFATYFDVHVRLLRFCNSCQIAARRPNRYNGTVVSP